MPVWYLANHPERRVGLATYEAGFAADWGRKVRDDIEANQKEMGLSPNKDKWAVDSFELMTGGGMNTAGVGGPFTGRGFHLLLIDDPIKNIEDALSPTMRDKVFDWFTRVAMTRLEPGGSVIGLMQRWHNDDLFGRIEREFGDIWTVVRMPMVAEEGDVLGRQVGEPLWPERYPLEECMKIKAAVMDDAWNSQYQQRPELNAGECWFDTGVLNTLYQGSKPGPAIGKYFAGRHYAAGIDCAGEGADRHSLTVKDCVTGLHVVQYASMEPVDIFALKVFNILKEFNEPSLGIEANGVGLAMTTVFKGLGYSNFVYQDEKREKVGIVSGSSNRWMWLVNYSMAVKNGTATPSTRDQIEEHLNFVKRAKGPPSALAGAHDDQVMSAVWAEYTASQVSVGGKYMAVDTMKRR